METINIKGKEYVTVNERLKEFRKTHKDYSLVTEIIELGADFCTMKASVIDDKGVIRATGYAREVIAKSPINKFAYVENCETSAIGRALGNFGIGIDESVCTADELVMKLSQGQETTAKSEFEATAKAEKAAYTRAKNAALKTGEFVEPKPKKTLEQRYNEAIPYLQKITDFKQIQNKKSVIDSVNNLLLELKNTGCQAWYENLMKEYDRLTNLDDFIPDGEINDYRV